MNGVGTLLFIFITKKKAPAYLGSSFAFLGPASLIISTSGFHYAQGAFIITGLLGCLIALIVYKFGTSWINVILPPAAMGAVVSLIGFELTGLTIRGGSIGANIMTESVTAGDITVFLITVGAAVLGSVLFKGFLSTIPILIASIAGYLSAVFFGMVDFSVIKEAGLFTLPHFQLPKFDIRSVITMLPVLLVITSEHISHQVVTSNIIGKDLLKDPGLHRSIFADNFSTALSGLVGGVPTTTYSVCMAFISPLAALIRTVPGNVIGGITFLLYGMIGASGIRLLVDSKIDYSKSKNLILTSVVFTTGLSGLTVRFGEIEFKGMVLASLVAVGLSLLFFAFEKAGLLESEKKST